MNANLAAVLHLDSGVLFIVGPTSIGGAAPASNGRSA